MLNNSGIYGANDAPNNMITSLNLSQSNSSKINHNLHSFGKMVQQAASSSSGQYEPHNYPNYGQPPMNVSPMMHPFQAYQTMGHASPYLPQNSPFSYENALQDYYPAVSTTIQAEHHNKMMNFHPNYVTKTSPEEIENESSMIKNYALNIPQIPTRMYQKNTHIDRNDYSSLSSPSSSSLLGNMYPDPTRIYQRSSVSDISDFDTPKNLSQSSKSLLDEQPTLYVKNEMHSPTNLSENRAISSENNSQSATPSYNIDDETYLNNSVNYSQNPFRLSDNYLSERKRKSLEKTVRLIESILIKSTNNNVKPDVVEPSTADPLAFSPRPPSPATSPNRTYSEDDKSQESDVEVDDTDSDDEVLIKKLRKNRSKDEKKISPSMKIQSIKRSHVVETETEIQFEKRMKLKHDDFNIKIECSDSLPEIDDCNPFHNDSNGVSRNNVVDGDVIGRETSVVEALEVIQKGQTSLTYFECPHCQLVLHHPKRFLIHTKWHTFGLLNDMRAETAREREDRVKGNREARLHQRLSASEATGVEDEPTFPCKDCEKAFQSRSGLKNHRRKFHAIEVTECRICLHPVNDMKALRVHMKTHEDKEAGVHQCPHCPKRFKYRHSLAKHADTHLEKTHGCPECSKMFGSVQLVRLHMKTHERMARGTTYHCSYCGKGFYEPYNLNVHERIHRNDKPFKCDICASCFCTNSSLKRHVKVSHSGAKPHTCKVCLKCFSTEAIRDRHELRVHSDQKQFPHECQLCPRRYMKPKDLRNHMYKMHAKSKKKHDYNSDPEAGSA